MTGKVLPRFRPGYGKANASHGVSALNILVPRSTLSPPLCYVRGGSSLAGCSASLASVLSPVPNLHPRQYLGEHEGTRRHPAQDSGPASKSKCPLHGAVAGAGPVAGRWGHRPPWQLQSSGSGAASPVRMPCRTKPWRLQIMRPLCTRVQE